MIKMSILLLLLASVASLSRAEDETEALVEWVKSLGAFIHPGQEIRRVNPEDPKSLRGIFATGDILEGDILLDLPTEAIIGPVPEKGDTLDMCGTISALKRELQLGDKSSFAPYVRVLNYTVSVPDSYSEEGKKMLQKVVGPFLFPQHIGRHLGWWSEVCKGDLENDELGANAVLLTVARASNSRDSDDNSISLMAPYYDMYNHRNGRHHNTKVMTKWKEDFRVVATRKINAGEQIFNSYGSRTPDILSHYGFVEQFPQTWFFMIPARDERAGRDGRVPILFEVDEDKDGHIAFSWLHDARPTKEDVDFLRFYEQNRLKSIEKEILCEDSGSCPDGIPSHELAVISQYYRALKSAIDGAVVVADATEPTGTEGKCEAA